MNDSSDDRDRSRERSRRGDRGDRNNRAKDSSRDRSADRGRDRGSKSSGNRVYVSNIPYEFRWQDLKDLFRVHVGEVQFVELFLDDKDKSRGCGVVEFADVESVNKCLEKMQRFEVKGRKIVVREDTGNAREKQGNSAKRGGGGNSSRDEGRFHRDGGFDSISSLVGRSTTNESTYGLSPSFLESLRIDLPLINRVFVANLAYNVDKKKLKEVFRLAGRLIRVDLPKDKDDRSRGFAIIEYDHPVEAVQAISMFHNQYLFDRQMAVRMDRNDNTKLPEGLKGVGMGLGTNGEPLKDVTRNLPSTNAQQQQQTNSLGSGLLGSVPSSALQVASALSGLNNINPAALSSLAGNSGVFQASGLAGNLLGAGDMSLASSLVQNQLAAHQPSQFGGLSGLNNASSGFGRSETGYGAGGGSLGNSRPFQNNFDASKPAPFGSGYGNNDRETASYGKLTDAAGLRGAVNVPKSTSGFSRKIVVSNLPTTASYKMLHDKFSEFGEVQHFEEKSAGTMLVMYSNEWQAERAIKNLDRARIDGRTIDASFFI